MLHLIEHPVIADRLVVCPEGVARLEDEHPDVPIFAAALDRQLDENGFIRPGLGDAGDRIFGTV